MEPRSPIMLLLGRLIYGVTSAAKESSQQAAEHAAKLAEKVARANEERKAQEKARSLAEQSGEIYLRVAMALATRKVKIDWLNSVNFNVVDATFDFSPRVVREIKRKNLDGDVFIYQDPRNENDPLFVHTYPLASAPSDPTQLRAT